MWKQIALFFAMLASGCWGMCREPSQASDSEVESPASAPTRELRALDKDCRKARSGDGDKEISREDKSTAPERHVDAELVEELRRAIADGIRDGVDAARASLEQETKALAARTESVETQISELRGQLADLGSETDDLRFQTTTDRQLYEETIADLLTRIDRLEAESAEYKAQLAKLTATTNCGTARRCRLFGR